MSSVIYVELEDETCFKIHVMYEMLFKLLCHTVSLFSLLNIVINLLNDNLNFNNMLPCLVGLFPCLYQYQFMVTPVTQVYDILKNFSTSNNYKYHISNKMIKSTLSNKKTSIVNLLSVTCDTDLHCKIGMNSCSNNEQICKTYIHTYHMFYKTTCTYE